jgi:hypothetical protein
MVAGGGKVTPLHHGFANDKDFPSSGIFNFFSRQRSIS